MRIIILSAFGGRLKSAPMEWESEPLEIRLPVTGGTGGPYRIGVEADLTAPVFKTAVFRNTGKYELISPGRKAAVYELAHF